MKTNVRKISLYGMLLALSMVLSYVEAMIPIHLGVPGVKLGLPNIVTVIGLYSLGAVPTAVLGVLRILLVSVLFGNTMTLMYSFSGFVLSLAAMLLLRRLGGFHRIVISVTGGAVHNLGQLLAAVLLLRSPVLFCYLPVLLPAGLLAGALIGLAAGWVSERLRPVL